MDTRLAMAFAWHGEQGIDVSRLCAEMGISRQTFYVYARRYKAEGVSGLLPRSRAPRSHPNQTPVEVEEEILRWRAELAGQGLDNGARSIWARMKRAGASPPHPRTIHRILVRRGLVDPEPTKRPRSSYKSFAAAAPNGIWQLDGVEVALADGSTQVVLRVLDDHSRCALATNVAETESAAAAWAVLQQAISRHGLPAMFLSDNSLAFNGSRKGLQVLVERQLRQLGVAVVASTARHPQTCGKAEREHRTFLKWLAARQPPSTAEELLVLTRTYDEVYNRERPHQASPDGLMTPEEMYRATAKATPAEQPLPSRPTVAQVKVNARGEVSAGYYRIQVGRGWEGVTVLVVRDGNSVAIFHRQELIDSRVIDPTRRYQPNGKKPLGGGRRLPRPGDIVSAK